MMSDHPAPHDSHPGQRFFFPPEAINQLLAHQGMRDLTDPRIDVPGADAPAMRWAEFWQALDILMEAIKTGAQFDTKADAHSQLFNDADGGGFGIRTYITDVVVSLLKPATRVENLNHDADTAAGGASCDEQSPDISRRAKMPAPMPAEARRMLGVYVYALIDPRDRKVFYVGKGVGDRVFHHVWALAGKKRLLEPADEASAHPDSKDTTSAKNDRIQSILDEGHVPEHWIVRHGISGDVDPHREAFAIEQALIDGMGLVTSSTLTNVMGGHVSTEHGLNLAAELVLRYSAPSAPPLPSPCALVKVNVASGQGLSVSEVYEASRRAWMAGRTVRAIPDLPILVFADDVVRAVHRVKRWDNVPDEAGHPTNWWEYTGDFAPDLEATYCGTSLREVRDARPDGKWRQHGWHPYP